VSNRKAIGARGDWLEPDAYLSPVGIGQRTRRGINACTLALLFQAVSAHAVVLPDDIQATLTRRYDAFVSAYRLTKIAPSRLRQDWYTRSRFPDPDTTTIERADAGINAATKALMLLESQEPPLPYARYRLIYRLDNAPDFSGYANAYVEVTRFNLGPVIHADTVASAPRACRCPKPPSASDRA
jgi:hypothetical protein